MSIAANYPLCAPLSRLRFAANRAVVIVLLLGGGGFYGGDVGGEHQRGGLRRVNESFVAARLIGQEPDSFRLKDADGKDLSVHSLGTIRGR
jgi:hypothetical protein